MPDPRDIYHRTATSTNRRSLLTFSLLMLAPLLFCGCQPRSNPADRLSPAQAKAVAALREMGADVYFDAGGDVTFVDFYGTIDTESGMVHLQDLDSLTVLVLNGTRIGDDELRHIAGLSNLRKLALNGTAVTDAGLAHLSGLAKLETLNLNDTQIGDAGLQHVTGLVNLRGINLFNTQVTDGGLVHLSELTKLEWVWLNHTQVTAEGVAKLQQALPDTRIFTDLVSPEA